MEFNQSATGVNRKYSINRKCAAIFQYHMNFEGRRKKNLENLTLKFSPNKSLFLNVPE